MLWHRQAIFKSKGDKLCSSAECRIWTRGPRHQIASRLNAHWQTDWAIEDQAKNLNSTVRPYDQRAFCPLDPTVSWLSHLALAIYIFVVVNFDALAQASDIQIERRQVAIHRNIFSNLVCEELNWNLLMLAISIQFHTLNYIPDMKDCVVTISFKINFSHTLCTVNSFVWGIQKSGHERPQFPLYNTLSQCKFMAIYIVQGWF